MHNSSDRKALRQILSILIALSLMLTLVMPVLAAPRSTPINQYDGTVSQVAALTMTETTSPSSTPTSTGTMATGIPTATSTITAGTTTVTPTATQTSANSPTATATVTLTATPATSTPTATTVAITSTSSGVDVGTEGGIVDLPGGAELIMPSGALLAPGRVSRNSVEMRLSNGLFRYHPIDQPMHIEARRIDNAAPLSQLQIPATVRLKLDRPEVPKDRVKSPAVRVLKSTGWELVPSSYDQASMVVTVSLTELPVTLAVVDDSQPVTAADWDPKDPAAVQFADGSWGVAYVDGNNPTNVLYRRSLGTESPTRWLDAVTVDSSADSPAMVNLGSTTALFYRKSVSSVYQVFMRTSTDYGKTWSTATQLTTETVSVYQIQASVTSSTVYLFFSLGNTSGLLQYRTSTDLSSWVAKASVGQAIGPLQNSTLPVFDIKRFSSGTWGLAEAWS